LFDPSLQRIPGWLRDFELHRSLRFVLHDDGSCCHLVSVAYISYSQRDQVTSAQLAVHT